MLVDPDDQSTDWAIFRRGTDELSIQSVEELHPFEKKAEEGLDDVQLKATFLRSAFADNVHM